MKKGKLLSTINEGVEKIALSNMNEDSFYDGYKFVEYGKNIQNVSLFMPTTGETDYSINKDKLIIKWGAKFEFRNSGIEGVQVTVLDLVATISSGTEKSIPINFAEYKFEVYKEKKEDSQDIQLFVSSIEIDAESKVVSVVVSI